MVRNWGFWSRCYIGISCWRQTYCWSPITKTHKSKANNPEQAPKDEANHCGPHCKSDLFPHLEPHISPAWAHICLSPWHWTPLPLSWKTICRIRKWSNEYKEKGSKNVTTAAARGGVRSNFQGGTRPAWSCSDRWKSDIELSAAPTASKRSPALMLSTVPKWTPSRLLTQDKPPALTRMPCSESEELTIPLHGKNN
jgi:hypothetical protein